ncbi:MAG: amidohydrolase [Planctomycetota bacterium]
MRTATVYTLDPRSPRAEAVLIDAGRVVAVGSHADAEQWYRPGDEVVERPDAVALPGLVDAHLHLMGYALHLRQADLIGVRSIEAAAARIAAHASTLGPGDWVVGRGWDRNRFEDPRWPTTAELEAASGGRPALLGSVDGHAAWATESAFRAAELWDGDTDPAGGRILRRADGRPAGVAFETAVDRLRAAVPSPSPGELRTALRHATERLAALGLTEVWTMDGRKDLGPALDCDAEAPLPLRVVVHADVSELGAAERLGARSGLGRGNVRLGGAKIYADGALGTRTAWMLDPYDDGDGTDRGIPVTPPEELRAAVARAAALGLPPCVHAIGDAAVRAVLDAFEALGAAGRAALPFPPRVEHAQTIHPDDLARFAALGVDASMQPLQIPLDIPIAGPALGARAARSYPFRSLRNAGARILLGSDAPVVSPDPYAGWRAAVARRPERDADGGHAGAWYPGEALTLEETVAAQTAGPITAGARADLAVVEPDPFQLDPADLDRVRAVCTVVDGRVTAAA